MCVLIEFDAPTQNSAYFSGDNFTDWLIMTYIANIGRGIGQSKVGHNLFSLHSLAAKIIMDYLPFI